MGDPFAPDHIFARGNARGPIVANEHDRNRFVETLAEAVVRSNWRFHAFVLMGNHCHLLLQTPEANLVEGMSWLQSTWTARYNARNRHVGHLFQGRYKAMLVDADEGYFLSVANYIHLSPARAGLFDLEKEKLQSYRWSSYSKHEGRWQEGILLRSGGGGKSGGIGGAKAGPMGAKTWNKQRRAGNAAESGEGEGCAGLSAENTDHDGQ